MRVGYMYAEMLEGTVKVKFHDKLDGRRTKVVELDCNDLVQLVSIVKRFVSHQAGLAARHDLRAKLVKDELVTS